MGNVDVGNDGVEDADDIVEAVMAIKSQQSLLQH